MISGKDVKLMTTQKFGGAWTQEKLNIFTSYLEAYLINTFPKCRTIG